MLLVHHQAMYVAVFSIEEFIANSLFYAKYSQPPTTLEHRKCPLSVFLFRDPLNKIRSTLLLCVNLLRKKHTVSSSSTNVREKISENLIYTVKPKVCKVC